jgi:hypothetical protein
MMVYNTELLGSRALSYIHNTKYYLNISQHTSVKIYSVNNNKSFL